MPLVKRGNHKKGFSLLETVAAMIVFSLVVTAGGGLWSSLLQSWRRQEGDSAARGNLGWAMEFISGEIRSAFNLAVSPGGESLGFDLGPDGQVNRFWYWRAGSVIYRGQGVDLAAAGGAAQELANLIIDNPSGSDIFILNGVLLKIELSAGKNNRDYTLISQARLRN